MVHRFLAYILLFLALAGWAFFALRDRPLREYAPIYFVAAAAGATTEFVLSRVLRLYEYESSLVPHPHDFALMGFFVTLGIDALFVVLYVRYSRRHPVVMAFVWAVMIMLLELLFLRVGAMFYPGRWNPLRSGVITVLSMLAPGCHGFARALHRMDLPVIRPGKASAPLTQRKALAHPEWKFWVDRAH